jgi:hypothetical protein
MVLDAFHVINADLSLPAADPDRPFWIDPKIKPRSSLSTGSYQLESDGAFCTVL